MTKSHFTIALLSQKVYTKIMHTSTSKHENARSDKYDRILDAAYELFVELGNEDISISEITERANVAKGTFYLYFQDKDDLKDQLIAQKSNEFFRKAVDALRATDLVAFDEQIIFVINYIINELSDNPMALRLIAKNLSFGVFNQKLQDYVSDEKSDIVRRLLLASEKSGVKLRNPRVLLFMIIELTGSTCFSCILESKPLSIEEYKPFLFATIRRMIEDATVVDQNS